MAEPHGPWSAESEKEFWDGENPIWDCNFVVDARTTNNSLLQV
jgi:hypothetical protein